MTPTKKIKAPEHLSRPSRRWYEQIGRTYVLEAHHLRLLELAARSWDRAEEARAALAVHGLTIRDRYGQEKARPEVNIERDSQLRFARLVRELCLDDNEPPEARAPRLHGRKD